MRKFLFILTTSLLLLVSLFPRSIESLNGNPVFGFDQGRDYLAVKHIVVDHKWTLIGAELGSGSAGISYLFQGPGYFYLLSIPFILFGGNPVAAVWLMLLFGLGVILFSFFIGKYIWGMYGGFLLAFLIALSPPLIAQSRFAWSPYPATIFIIVVFFSIYVFLEKGRARYLFLAALSSAIIYNFEFAMAVPLCITLFCFTVIFSKRKIYDLLVLLAAYILAFLPMILFEVRHGFLGTHSLITYLTTSHGASKHFSYATHFYSETTAFIYNFSNSFPGNGFIPGLLFFILFLFLLVYVARKEKNAVMKKMLYYFGILFVVNIFVFLALKNDTYMYYLADLNISYLFLSSYIVFSLIKQKHTDILKLVIILLVVFISYGSYTSLVTSLKDYSDYGGTSKLRGKVDAINAIYSLAHGKPFTLLVFSPPVYTYPYQYLVWWEAKNKFHYVPSLEKKGTVFLLIEPDPQKPWTYRGWLETVIKSGKVVYTRTLPSGFIIQRREI